MRHTMGKYPRAVMTSVVTALGQGCWFFRVFVCLFYGTLGNIFSSLLTVT